MPPLDSDYYAILSIPRSASPSDIKFAYHRALLLHHPDKQSLRVNGRGGSEGNGHAPIAGGGDVDVDIGLIQEAYTTLSSTELRAEYDARRSAAAAKTSPRPAQVVSLEEFVEEGEEGVWAYACRCGGKYTIREAEMEQDEHLVGCSGCSEVVWVGYEVADDDGEGEE